LLLQQRGESPTISRHLRKLGGYADILVEEKGERARLDERGKYGKHSGGRESSLCDVQEGASLRRRGFARRASVAGLSGKKKELRKEKKSFFSITQLGEKNPMNSCPLKEKEGEGEKREQETYSSLKREARLCSHEGGLLGVERLKRKKGDLMQVKKRGVSREGRGTRSSGEGKDPALTLPPHPRKERWFSFLSMKRSGTKVPHLSARLGEGGGERCRPLRWDPEKPAACLANLGRGKRREKQETRRLRRGEPTYPKDAEKKTPAIFRGKKRKSSSLEPAAKKER